MRIPVMLFRRSVRTLAASSLANVLLVLQAGAQNVKLNPPLFPDSQGGVHELRASDDGRWCVYRATEGSQALGLFSVPVDGSSGSRRLVPEGMDVEDFDLSSELVLVESQHNLFVVPIDASRPPVAVLPWNPLRVTDEIGITADGSRVVYLERVPGTTRDELYSAEVHGDGPPVELDTGLSEVEVRDFLISPDGGRVVFSARQDDSPVVQILSVPIDGSAAPVDLTPPAVRSARSSRGYEITPDGARVVYRVDQDLNRVFELFSAPIDGSSAPVKLNTPLPSGRHVEQFRVSQDGRRVVYLADFSATNVFELFSVPIEGGSPPVRLNGPLVPGSDVDFDFEISPNSRLVAFIAQLSPTEAALWVAPIDGRFPARAIQANPMTMGRFTPDSRRIVVRVRKGEGPIDLYSVTIGRGGARNLTETPDGVGQWVFEYFITPDGASIVYLESFSATSDLRRVPVDGHSSPAVLCSFWAWNDLVLTSDGRFLLFRAEPACCPPYDFQGSLFSVPVDGHRGLLELNGPLVTEHVIGDVTSLRVSPQGSVAFMVYVPQRGFFLDNDFMEIFGVTPGPDPQPVRLTPTEPFERRITAYEFAANGERVVYRTDFDETSHLFSVPVDGHEPPLLLDDTETTFGSVGEFTLDPAGLFAVFDADVGSWSELFRVALTGGPELPLSGSLVAGGGFQSFQVAPGSARVVYVADQLANDRFELFSVPSDGSAGPVRLNGTLPANADVDEHFLIHPDGSTVLALGELLANDVRELFRVPVDGSAAPARLSAPLVAGGNVERGFRIGPDGLTVVYLADQEQNERFELYAVPLDGSASPVKLNGALVAGGDVQPDFAFTPDGSNVVYRADAESDERFELFGAALDGSLRVKLNPALVAEGDVRAEFLVTPDSKRVLFRADRSADERIELFSALLDGGGSLTVNGDLAPGGQVAELLRPSVDGLHVFYAADQRTDELLELFMAPVDREKGSRVLSGPFLPGSDVSAIEPTSDGKGILYLADQDIDSVVELYFSALAPAVRPGPPGGLVRVR